MTPCPGCGWLHDPGRLHDAVQAADDNPAITAGYDDATLIALTAWSNASSVVLRAEAERRRGEHQALADRFATAVKATP
jgi:hypothetical protein